MANQWYYSQQGQRIGPVTDQQLKQLATSGQIQPSTQVWKQGLEKWVAAQRIKGLFPESDVPISTRRNVLPDDLQTDLDEINKLMLRGIDTAEYIEKRGKDRIARWQHLANGGVAAAQWLWGFCFGNGHGVPQDWAEAVKWYRKAAEQGNADAQNSLGFCYANGHGVPQDFAEAAKWVRVSAEQGNAVAQINLRPTDLGGN